MSDEVEALCVKLEHCYDVHPFAFEAKQAAVLIRDLRRRLNEEGMKFDARAAVLDAERAELARDAARYRFIRRQTSNVGVMIDGIDSGLALESLDDAIDNAMQSKEVSADSEPPAPA